VGQVFLLYKLNNSNSSFLLRFETNIIMMEYNIAAKQGSNDFNSDIQFFCKICNFIRFIVRTLYWRLELDELVECPCKGHAFNLEELFQTFIKGLFQSLQR
jgi:hypothetical protein